MKEFINKYLSSFFILKKKNILILGISILLLVVIAGLYKTYAIDTQVTKVDENTYDIVLTEQRNAITLPANESKTVIYQLHNPNEGTVKYALGFTNSENMKVKVWYNTQDEETGLVERHQNKFVKLKISNTSTTEQTTELSTVLGYEHGGDLIVPSDTTLVTEKVKNPLSPSNEFISSIFSKTTEITNKCNQMEEIDGKNKLIKDMKGNIRYYGANPKNYIYFNCDNYPDTNCEIWRIIGIVDGKLKLIRNENIGKLSWDSSASDFNSGYGINQWGESGDYSGSDLMKLLNEGYESETKGGSLYYNSQRGNCYNRQNNSVTTCDFTSTGIKSKTKILIADATYYTGGISNVDIYACNALQEERKANVLKNASDGIIRTTTWTGKIAVPYPSDYGYATDLTKCIKKLRYYHQNYNTYYCRDDNWMWYVMTNSRVASTTESNLAWLITPYSNLADDVTAIGNYGYESGGTFASNTYEKHEIVPVLYLEDNVIIETEHIGDANDPYRINIR